MSSPTRSFVLAVDKPAGPTSHDVVAWARRAFRTRAVGHAGTLDPAATGVLVLAVGEATKLVPHLSLDDKEYDATITLGEETDTLDAVGEVVERAPVPESLERAAVQARADDFLGRKLQRAPRVSAIKQGGVALHARVRRGEVVEAPLREVELFSVEVLAVEGHAITLRVHVGKGFYVRSFARDLALALGTRGHLSALRRTRSGGFSLADAVPGELLRLAARGGDDAAAALEGATAPRTRDLLGALPHLPVLELDAALERDARHGKLVAHPGIEALGEGAICLLAGTTDGHRRLVAIAERAGDRARVVRGFAAEQDDAADAPAPRT